MKRAVLDFTARFILIKPSGKLSDFKIHRPVKGRICRGRFRPPSGAKFHAVRLGRSARILDCQKVCSRIPIGIDAITKLGRDAELMIGRLLAGRHIIGMQIKAGFPGFGKVVKIDLNFLRSRNYVGGQKRSENKYARNRKRISAQAGSFEYDLAQFDRARNISMSFSVELKLWH
jgi:hypothetical protein